MAQQLQGEIRDLVQGDYVDILRTIDSLPATISKAWFTVQPSKSASSDTTAIFQKTITSSLVANQGQITDTGASGTASVIFQLVNTDTILMINEKVYYYDIQVLTSTGKIYTPEAGTIRLKSEQTKAIS